jgi:hypothetical protein
MWACRACRRKFANRNQEHSCGRFPLAAHFRGKDRTLFDAYLRAVREIGPVSIQPNKTRIGIQVRMIFSAVMVRKSHLRGHFVFARRVEHPRFLKVETISPRNHLHHWELRRVEEIDGQFREWFRESYAVGERKHR